MRLWHKELIHCLPKNQLLGQWRECCCIAKSIAEKGTPNHILVNKIMDYPIDHFAYYCRIVYRFMEMREYKCNPDLLSKYLNIDWQYSWVYVGDLFRDWHNPRYYKQCYYNLQEKYDCGGISDDEWEKILRAIQSLGFEKAK